MAAAVVLTVLSGLDYVYRALTLRQTSARAMQAAAERRAAGPTGSGEARTDTAA
jgi:CDP-diacylglycerol--glycerol-3-phosphate 3-phosphatidyltransferase